MRKAAAVVGVLAVLVVAGSGGAWLGLHRTTTGSQPAGSAAPAPAASVSPTKPAPGSRQAPAALRRFYTQTVHWTHCKADLQCAHLLVPLDYRRPRGATIRLLMEMRPASDQAGKAGTLLVNPGGPGAMATDLVDEAPLTFGDPLLRHFDIVGLNPRGTTGSDPVNCLTDRQMDQWVAADPVPTTPAEVARVRHWDAVIAKGCESRPIGAHVSTVEAARDMDVFRAAMGESRLDYLGFSYGTELGTVYADLFPHRVGRFVLDGAVAPKMTALQESIQQAAGFQRALDSYIGECLAKAPCFLGDSRKAAFARIESLLTRIQQQPLPAGGRTLYAGNALTGIAAALYDRSTWSYLTSGLKQAFAGQGQTLLLLSDAYSDRSPGGGYRSNLLEANAAITCLDDPSSIPIDKVPSLLPRFRHAAPVFGPAFAWSSTTCSDFHEHAEQKAPPVGAPGAAPIVVIGTTRDPATPYSWAVRLAHDLKSGVLITRNGDGHTGYHEGNACVDHAVEGYLVDGTVPRDGLRC